MLEIVAVDQPGSWSKETWKQNELRLTKKEMKLRRKRIHVVLCDWDLGLVCH